MNVPLSITQKMQALMCLDPMACLRLCGDKTTWYCSVSAEIKEGAILSSPAGYGATPKAAIEHTWKLYTELPEGQYVVVKAMDSDKRRAYRWGRFMWEPVTESTR